MLQDASAALAAARNADAPAGIWSSAMAGIQFRARLSAAAASPRHASGWWSMAPAAAAILGLALAGFIIFGIRANAEGPRPDAHVTPGETRAVTIEQICRPDAGSLPRPEISIETRRKIFSLYGINPAHLNRFEVDYLITPELGGADSLRNLWPQPYSTRWNAHVKDKLETRLHQLVCSGKLDLSQAQHDIASDWIGAYRRYVSQTTSN